MLKMSNISEQQWQIQILIQEKIKRILNSGNACYRLVQDLVISFILKKRKHNFACGSVWNWNFVSKI
jgi:hypothetical protein